ncbi:MAG: DMT family transporter [Vicinamibacteria bacterium]
MASAAAVADNRPVGLRANAEAKGLLLVLLAACAYGTMPILTKIAYASGVTLPALLAYRFLLAALLFAVLGWNAPALPWRKRVLLWAIGSVFVGNALAYFTALQHTPAAVASLLLYTYPVMVTLVAPLLGLERLRTRGVLAAVLAFSGCALTAAGAGMAGASPKGVVLTLVSALVYAFYVVLSSRFASDIPAEAASAHLAQACAVYFVAAGAWRGELAVPPTVTAWGLIVAIAVICTVVALRTFLAGLALIGPGRAAVASSVEVLITIALAVAFLGERIGTRELLGGSLILGAVALHNLRPQWRRGRAAQEAEGGHA